ncbi:MAG: tetratricopeptide repeat protein [Phycisphaerae bacterium]|nr:tetratricopeptide repeat protein [Phycisphaerae bacterium]
MKTTTTKMIRRIGILVVFGSGMFAMVGCSDMHQENLQLAEARWSRARAAVQLQLGEQQYKTGQLDKALVTVGQASSLDPTYPRTQLLRGQILAEKGQGQAAVSAFDGAIALDSRCAEAYYCRGVQYEKWGQFDKALASYQLARSSAPGNVCYTIATAEILGHLNRLTEALALIDETLLGQEQSVSLRVTAGELCQAHGDNLKAAKYFREAARLATDDTTILRSLALALYRAGKYDEAKGYLEQLNSQRTPEPVRSAGVEPRLSSTADPKAAEAAEPTSAERAEVLSALGDCYLSAGQPESARNCFAELCRLCPKRADAWENMAKAALARGKWDEAAANADKALALASNSAGAQLIRGYALLQGGKPAEAVWAFQKAHRLAPKDVLMLCLLSESYRRTGNSESAREALVRALQIAPDDALANRMLNGLAKAGGKGVRDDAGTLPTVTAGVKVNE